MKYVLYQKNYRVAELDIQADGSQIIGIGEIFDQRRITVGVITEGMKLETEALNHWWKRRSIPASRSGIDRALRVLNLSVPQELLSKCFGLSLSDQYWIKPIDSDISWEKINFFDNVFTEDMGNILFGNKPQNDSFSMMSPDCTADGTLRKKWKLIDEKRCLIKGGNFFQQEPFNEVISCRIAKRLGIPHTEYRVAYEGKNKMPVSVCEDFIDRNTELVTAAGIARVLPRSTEDDKWTHFLKCCEHLQIPNYRESLENILLLDYLIANQDRHMGNFGAVRNADTLEYIGFSPIFDCGTSLRYDTPNEYIELDIDIESQPFRSFHSEQLQLILSLDRFDLTALDGIEDEIADIFDDERASVYIKEERVQKIIGVLMTRIDNLKHELSAVQYEEAEQDSAEDEEFGQGMTML